MEAFRDTLPFLFMTYDKDQKFAVVLQHILQKTISWRQSEHTERNVKL